MWMKTKDNLLVNTALINSISVDNGSDCDYDGFDEPYIVSSATASLSHNGNIYAHPLAGFENQRAAVLFLEEIFQALAQGKATFDCAEEARMAEDTVKKELETLLP